MQLTLDFIDKPIKVIKKTVKAKAFKSEHQKWADLPRELKVKASIKNYFSLPLHWRINHKTWYCYNGLHFCEQTFSQTSYITDEGRLISEFYLEYYDTGQWK